MKKLILFLLLAAPVFGQATVAPFTNSKVQFFDNSGLVCSGCKLNTYSAGTTSPLATYSDSAGSVPNANPIQLDSAGRATIYLTSASYKFVLTTSAGTTLWSQDNISWLSPMSSFNGLASAGNFDITQPTAATSGANQSSFTNCLHGNYWTGSASADDKWCFSNILGTGTNPSSTLTLTHSGSSGTASVSWPNALFDLGSLGNLRFSSDTNVSRIGAGIVGFGTGAQGNAGATTRQAIVQIGGASTGLSQDSAGVVDVGNGTQGDKSGRANLTTLGLYTGGLTPATIVNDGAGGINLSTNSGKTWEVANSGVLNSPLGGNIQMQGATSGQIQITVPAVAGSNTLTMPAATDTLVGRATTDTLTNKTLTSPAINGTPTGTGIPTVTLKKGSGGGTYSSASLSYVQVDGTNLSYTVTIPTGWKLAITASFRMATATASVFCTASLADGGTTLVETGQQSIAAGTAVSSSLAWVITGDGASHTIDLRYKTSNASDAVNIGNTSSTDVPVMVFILTPSN